MRVDGRRQDAKACSAAVGTVTAEIVELARWLKEFGVTHVAMESTGVYWKPIRDEQMGRRTKVDFGFVGDIKTTLRALPPKLQDKENEVHLRESLEHYRKTRKGLDDLATGNSGKKPIHSQYVCARCRSARRRRCGFHL